MKILEDFMEKSPIKKQQGLSQDDLNKMKPTEQIYKDSGDISLLKSSGVKSQQYKISNRIHSILSGYYERMKTMDSKDDYAQEKELNKLADDLTDFICDLVSAQKVTITSSVETTDTLVGTVTNVTTGVTAPMTLVGSGKGTGSSTIVDIS